MRVNWWLLLVGNQYLLTVASATRLDTTKAQLNTAQTIFQQTQDLKKAGVAAGIDVLRSQVQMQTLQQRVLAAQTSLSSKKCRWRGPSGYRSATDSTGLMLSHTLRLPP